jgi:NADH-quinone oxidoreductase subunit C
MNIQKPVATIYGDHVARFSETWKAHIEALRSKFGDAIEDTRFPGQHPCDVPIVYVHAGAIADVLRFLKDELEYAFLSDITATDEQPEEPRFEVVYNLYALRKQRLRLKVRVAEGAAVPTACDVWPAANWAEREVWDMFGIRFTGHPDLRRILMDERWQGHPLRKDYPLRGYQIFTEPEQINEELLK